MSTPGVMGNQYQGPAHQYKPHFHKQEEGTQEKKARKNKLNQREENIIK